MMTVLNGVPSQTKRRQGYTTASQHDALNTLLVLVMFLCLSYHQIIPPQSLSFLRQIGSGQFGEVHVGRLRLKDGKHGGVATNDLVAIKLMKGKN